MSTEDPADGKVPLCYPAAIVAQEDGCLSHIIGHVAGEPLRKLPHNQLRANDL